MISPLTIWRILWIGWFTLVIFATTTPWSKFDGSPHWESVLWIPFSDFTWSEGVLLETVANLLLFVPLGYLTVRSLGGDTRTPVLIATMIGLFCSTSVELFQVFCHDRVPSTTDILTNVMGTFVGGEIAAAIDRFFTTCVSRLRAL
jgi:glycopeptide antibiotics resistance protein